MQYTMITDTMITDILNSCMFILNVPVKIVLCCSHKIETKTQFFNFLARYFFKNANCNKSNLGASFPATSSGTKEHQPILYQSFYPLEIVIVRCIHFSFIFLSIEAGDVSEYLAIMKTVFIYLGIDCN